MIPARVAHALAGMRLTARPEDAAAAVHKARPSDAPAVLDPARVAVGVAAAETWVAGDRESLWGPTLLTKCFDVANASTVASGRDRVRGGIVETRDNKEADRMVFARVHRGTGHRSAEGVTQDGTDRVDTAAAVAVAAAAVVGIVVVAVADAAAAAVAATSRARAGMMDD